MRRVFWKMIKRQVLIKMLLNTMFITAVCVIFLIKLRWPKNKSLYDTSFIMFFLFELHALICITENHDKLTQTHRKQCIT